MKDKVIKMAPILIFSIGLLGASLSSSREKRHLVLQSPKLDTAVIVRPADTVVSVKGKKVLFIGDSHTAYSNGWQDRLCRRTGMTYFNSAVGGKQTQWMVGEARQRITNYFDYCFIYGGANDMAGNRSPMKSVKNVQIIVDLCIKAHVKPIVVTGFDPITCIDIRGRDVYRGYPQRYARFQQLLVDSIRGATVVKTHYISRTDCGDFLCHMSASGHRKMADSIIKTMKFKIIK
jgi:hypothetical protein